MDNTIRRGVAVESLESRRLLSAVKLGSISGSVFADLDRDGRHDVGEGGVKKAVVFLDLNGNRQFDKKTDLSAVTDKYGAFKFSKLKAGTYRLYALADGKSAISTPRAAWFKIKLSPGQNVVRRLFGNFTRTASEVTTTDGSNLAGSFTGDFDYSGKVDGADYALIDAAFNGQSGTTTTTTTPRTAVSAAQEDFALTQDDSTTRLAKNLLSGNRSSFEPPQCNRSPTTSKSSGTSSDANSSASPRTFEKRVAGMGHDVEVCEAFARIPAMQVKSGPDSDPPAR